jgi:hypothetical protein
MPEKYAEGYNPAEFKAWEVRDTADSKDLSKTVSYPGKVVITPVPGPNQGGVIKADYPREPPFESHFRFNTNLDRTDMELSISGRHEQVSKLYEELIELVQKHKKGIIPDDGK